MSQTTGLSLYDAWIKKVLFVDPRAPAPTLDKLLSDIKRIKGEIDTQLAPARKPVALLDRVKYVTSELRELRSAIDRYPGDDQDKLVKSADQLQTLLTAARDTGMQKSADALSREAGSLHAEAMEVDDKVIAAISGDGAKTVYKDLNRLLTRVTRARDDWEAQVTEAGGELRGLATRMQTGFERLAQTEEHLNRMIRSCLPPLTSKTGKKPDNAPTGVVTAITNPAQAITGCGNDWVTAKQTYGANPTEMQKLADYRKNLVDTWLNEKLGPWGMAEGPGRGWVAVGSTDPTSDYDISINKHGSRITGDKTEYYLDYKIVQDFNKHFRTTYGVESGTLFDTNLYASAPSQAPNLPENGSPQEQAAVADVKASADVGSLMKIRRYMSTAEFEDYRVRTVALLPEGPKRDALDRQFRAADANYMVSLLDIVERMREQLKDVSNDSKLSKEQKHERDEARELIAAWEKGQDISGLALADAEDALERLVSKLLHCRDASTTATNDLYADAIGKKRDQEQAITEFQENLPQVKELLARAIKEIKEGDLDFGAFAKVLEGYGVQPRVLQHVEKGDLEKAAAELDGQLAGMMADLARHSALAMFYANEAYQSGGPFQHVVWAGQAVETDTRAEYIEAGGNDWPPPPAKPNEAQQKLVDAKRKERREKLTREESLQSFNEQLGDFLKDLEHYGDADPGVAIIQSSKYLDRLVDALRLMHDKGLFEADQGLKTRIEDQLALQSRLSGELIAARKGNLWMVPEKGDAPVDQVEQRRAYACKFMADLGIASVAALGKTYVKLGVEVNGVARKAMAG
jgi:hypothetical protein